MTVPPIPLPTVGVLNKTNLFTRPWYDWLRQWWQWAVNIDATVASSIITQTTGTYLPIIAGSTTNPTVTYSHQEGFWVRIGSMVTFHAHVIVTTFSGGTGTAQMTLPMIAHTAGGPSNYDPTFPAFTSDVDWGTGKQFLYARVLDGTIKMNFESVANAQTSSPLALSGFNAGSEVAVSATYWTDAP